MLFRRLLIISSALLLTVAVIALAITPSLGVSTSGQFADSLARIAANRQTLNCPDAPAAAQGLFLDFCSPKYVGNVAGPFGSRIVLVAENFPEAPQTWIVSKDKTVTHAQDIPACLQDNQCSGLPQPAQSSQHG